MRRRFQIAAIIAVLALAGCGGAKQNRSAHKTAGLSQAIAYSRCMRSHGVTDYPDPTLTTSGGHRTLRVTARPDSDLDPDNPAFRRANDACRSLVPGGEKQTSSVSNTQLTDELRWAACLRSHGLPGFPDPDSNGAFNYSELKQYVSAFTDRAPLVVRAAHACKPYQPRGSVPATP